MSKQKGCPYLGDIERDGRKYYIQCALCKGAQNTPYDRKSDAQEERESWCQKKYKQCRFYKEATAANKPTEELAAPAEAAPPVAIASPELSAAEPPAELATPRRLEDITAEIRFYKAQTVQNIIEIGKRLTEAKEQLEHGQWLPWLEREVEFHERTARKFMQLASEYSNRPPGADLEYTKLVTLLAVPADERDEFIEAPHEVDGEQKTVTEMSRRELEQVIKERDEAIKKAAEAKEAAEIARLEADLSRASAKSRADQVAKLCDENDRKKEELELLRKRLEEQERRPIDVDVAVQELSQAELDLIRSDIRNEIMAQLPGRQPGDEERVMERFENMLDGAMATLLALAENIEYSVGKQLLDEATEALQAKLNHIHAARNRLLYIARTKNPDDFDLDDEF